MAERELVLASRSPQRRAILEQLGIEFSIDVPEVEELEQGSPPEVAVENARRKASAVAERLADAVVLGVDTVVCIGQQMYGKPAGPDQARVTLRALAGRRHTVISAVCMIDPARGLRTAAPSTEVQFRELGPALIDWYVASDEWRDRAGAYAIQGRGAALVAAIDGDYWNVVGLPVPTLLELAPELVS